MKSSDSLPTERVLGVLAALCVFFGAVLLFCVQPMMGRLLLPRFGGVATVWIVCLLIYQVLLFVGYAYAHWLCGRSLRAQFRIHAALVAVALLWPVARWLTAGFPLALGDVAAGWPPQWRAGLLLILAVGPTYLCLSATSTLVQAWLARRRVDARVYHLYGISNAGSFAGLLLYPFVMEMFLHLQMQQGLWLAGFVLFAGVMAAFAWTCSRSPVPASLENRPTAEFPVAPLCERQSRALTERGDNSAPSRPLPTPTHPHSPTPIPACAHRARLQQTQHTPHTPSPTPPHPHTLHSPSTLNPHPHGSRGRSPSICSHNTPTPPHSPSPLLWLGLSMAGTFLLVAGTSHLTLDITPLPALWVIILGAYLLTFVIGFSRLGEKLLPLWCLLALGTATAQAVGDYGVRVNRHAWALASGLAMVFFGALFLHAWLHARRPPARDLSRFYLYVAGGGGLGGILGSLVAPAVFPAVWEYPLSVVAVVGFAWLYLVRDNPPQIASAKRLVVFVALAVVLFNGATLARELSRTVALRRGFYGLVRIVDNPFRTASGEVGNFRQMIHGSTMHGGERRIGDRRLSPASYFTDFAGGPLALAQHPRRNEPGFHVGVIGLGVGELLGYARETDRWRVYEISPEVLELAEDPKLFTYVSDCPAELEIVLDDARRALERERNASGVAPFDVLFVDAYSGDAVPLHLITREAFELFLERLAPDGFLVLQMTNWHLDLFPLAKAAAREFDLHIAGVMSKGMLALNAAPADWVILSRQPLDLNLVNPEVSRKVDWEPVAEMPLLTDARGSVLRFLRVNWAEARQAVQPKAPRIDFRDLISD